MRCIFPTRNAREAHVFEKDAKQSGHTTSKGVSQDDNLVPFTVKLDTVVCHLVRRKERTGWQDIHTNALTSSIVFLLLEPINSSFAHVIFALVLPCYNCTAIITSNIKSAIKMEAMTSAPRATFRFSRATHVIRRTLCCTSLRLN